MKILLAEDQVMVRTALASLIRLEAEFEVDEACDGKEAQEKLQCETYDLLLTDIEMPNLSGLELVHWVKENQPQVQCVIMTTFNRAGYIKRAIDAGVRGFLLKDAPIQTLMSSLQQVVAGQQVISNELLMQAIGHEDPLTEKERQALRLAGEGLSTQAIAQKLFIAEGTARNYLSEAINKMHASNRIEAARIAHQKGWL